MGAGGAGGPSGLYKVTGAGGPSGLYKVTGAGGPSGLYKYISFFPVLEDYLHTVITALGCKHVSVISSVHLNSYSVTNQS